MELREFIRKPFAVQAVQITEENMEDVAKRCNGNILDTPSPFQHRGPRYIQVTVENVMSYGPRTVEEQRMGFVGDWVVLGKWGKDKKRTWKVYKNTAFRNSFNEAPVESPCSLTEFTADFQPCVLGAGHRARKNPTGCRSLTDYKFIEIQ